MATKKFQESRTLRCGDASIKALPLGSSQKLRWQDAYNFRKLKSQVQGKQGDMIQQVQFIDTSGVPCTCELFGYIQKCTWKFLASDVRGMKEMMQL